MSSPARPVAKCVVRWIYEQASWVLRQLKNLLLSLITTIDAYILILRAQAAQWDLLAQGEQFIWDQVKGVLDETKNQLSAIPDGPVGDVCPEFVIYFTDPILGLLEVFTRSLNYLHEDVNASLSYMDELDRLILYWENTKLDLVAAVDIIDAALLEALEREAESIP